MHPKRIDILFKKGVQGVTRKTACGGTGIRSKDGLPKTFLKIKSIPSQPEQEGKRIDSNTVRPIFLGAAKQGDRHAMSPRQQAKERDGKETNREEMLDGAGENESLKVTPKEFSL